MTKIIQGFIIGGSPSTGSSLLRQILNRHSEIVCAPETHIWCKEKIFEDWHEYNYKLTKKSIFGLVSEGFFHFVGIDKSQVPNYNSAKTKKLLKNSPDIYTFFRLFMMEFFDLKAGQIYGEKTPANTINFRHILATSNDVMCIHTVRNPYDTIASLVARGKTPIEAVAFYLYNCAHGMSFRDGDERIATIRYEHLVENPRAEISNLLASMSLDFEENMLDAGSRNNKEVTKLESWNYDETDKVQKGSVGRFHSLSQELQEEIVLFVWFLRLKDSLHLKVNSIEEICEKLDYQMIVPDSDLERYHLDELKEHQHLVTKKHNNFDFMNYPLYFE